MRGNHEASSTAEDAGVGVVRAGGREPDAPGESRTRLQAQPKRTQTAAECGKEPSHSLSPVPGWLGGRHNTDHRGTSPLAMVGSLGAAAKTAGCPVGHRGAGYLGIASALEVCMALWGPLHPNQSPGRLTVRGTVQHQDLPHRTDPRAPQLLPCWASSSFSTSTPPPQLTLL